jgi:hypothetical protein
MIMFTKRFIGLNKRLEWQFINDCKNYMKDSLVKFVIKSSHKRNFFMFLSDSSHQLIDSTVKLC